MFCSKKKKMIYILDFLENKNDVLYHFIYKLMGVQVSGFKTYKYSHLIISWFCPSVCPTNMCNSN